MAKKPLIFTTHVDMNWRFQQYYTTTPNYLIGALGSKVYYHFLPRFLNQHCLEFVPPMFGPVLIAKRFLSFFLQEVYFLFCTVRQA